jgi:hypothetical protein
MKKYRFRLRADIAHDVAMQNVTNFGEMVQKSYHAEASLRDSQRERGDAMQRKKESGKFNFSLKTKGTYSKDKHNYSPRSPRKCPECGSHHSGTCMRGQGICYYCRKQGHMRNECPELKKQSGAEGSKGKGRIYSLDGHMIKSNNNLIMDVCLLGQSEVLVLFDCGATNSFISVDCVIRLGLPSVPLIPPMIVAVATGGKVTSKRVCPNCPVLVGSKTYHIDLICLPIKDLDVVLGMDWISANTVYIGCAEKNLFIPTEVSAESRALTALLQNTHQMIQYLSPNNKCFSIMFTVNLESSISLSDIPIVNEYTYVFPEDIMSLPPEREVEFSIDLVPGSQPISVAPY